MGLATPKGYRMPRRPFGMSSTIDATFHGAQVTDSELTSRAPDSPVAPAKIVDAAKDAAQSAGFKAQIYKAIAVQRPVVLEVSPLAPA